MENHIYADKSNCYFQNVRKELLDLIPQNNRNGSILEIGAGGGNTLMYAKQHGYASKITGIELCQLPNTFQDDPSFETFIVGNIENIDLPFENEQFDVILCADVLEHLANPYTLVKRLKSYLKKDGVLITSIPNIREWHVMYDVFFRGDFKYVEAGILDKTHLRFFCKQNIEALFVNEGYEIIKNISNITIIGHKSKIFNRLTFKLFEEFITSQYYTISQKK